MGEENKIITVTIIIIATFLSIGIYTTFNQSNQSYEDTEVLYPDSEIILESHLQRGDQVKINLSTLENREARIQIEGRKMSYRVQGSSVDITIPISREADYRFEISNPNESYIFVTYFYEISYMHSYWTGVTSIVFSASLLIALFFRFRKKFMRGLNSLYER